MPHTHQAYFTMSIIPPQQYNQVLGIFKSPIKLPLYICYYFHLLQLIKASSIHLKVLFLDFRLFLSNKTWSYDC